MGEDDVEERAEGQERADLEVRVLLQEAIERGHRRAAAREGLGHVDQDAEQRRVEGIELPHQGRIEVAGEVFDRVGVLAEGGVHRLVEGLDGFGPSAQHAARGHLVEILIFELERRAEAIADEAELRAKALLGDVSGARLGDVLLYGHRDEERHHAHRRPVVIDEGRELVDLRHVLAAVLAPDPDHQLVDEPGDGRVAVLLGVARDAGEALGGGDPQILGADGLGSVIPPALEAGRQIELLIEIAFARALVELGAGEGLVFHGLGHELFDAAVVALGVVIDQLEDPLFVGELERRHAGWEGRVEGVVERGAQRRLAHHVDADHQRPVLVEPVVPRSERGEARIAHRIDCLVALQHLAEHRHQVRFAAAEGAKDEAAGVAALREARAHVVEHDVELLLHLVGQDELLEALEHPIFGVVEAGDELVEGGDLGQIEGFTDPHGDVSGELSSVFERLPIEAELADDSSYGAELQLFGAPVRDHRRHVRGRVEPLAVGPAGAARQLLTAESRELPGDVAVLHAASTRHSNKIGACGASWRRFGGRGLPRSS